MRTNASRENRTLNDFGQSYLVATLWFGGFVLSATGVIVNAPGLAVLGFLLLLGGVGLYGRWLV